MKKWNSYEEIADWSSAMIPRLISAFGLSYWFKIVYEMSDDLPTNSMGSFSLKFDDETGEAYGLIKVSADLINKKDILATILHELIHGHCVAFCTMELMGKGITKEEFNEAIKKEQLHDGIFAKRCRDIGFGGDMSSTKPKPALIKKLLSLDFETDL